MQTTLWQSCLKHASGYASCWSPACSLMGACTWFAARPGGGRVDRAAQPHLCALVRSLLCPCPSVHLSVGVARCRTRIHQWRVNKTEQLRVSALRRLAKACLDITLVSQRVVPFVGGGADAKNTDLYAGRPIVLRVPTLLCLPTVSLTWSYPDLNLSTRRRCTMWTSSRRTGTGPLRWRYLVILETCPCSEACADRRRLSSMPGH